MLTQTRNKYFTEQLFYADCLPQAAHACYNGNIAAAHITLNNFQSSFAYFYDALNRLTESKQLVLNLSTTNSERFTFTGKERDAETGYDYFGARYRGPKFLDYFLSVDPLADKYIDNSPYVYCSGNPIMLVDPSGMDEEQREAGKKMAEQYIKMNPNKSEAFYELGKKGGPGQKVDCSGLVSRCIVAGEEEDPSKKGVGNGVRRIANNTQKIEDMNDIMVGNLVTFYGEANGEYSHIGYITDVILDDNGNVADFLFIHAAKSTGPTINGYKESSYWRKRVSGFYKWDTHPDVYNGLPLPPIIVFGKMPERPILTRALHVIP